MGVALSYPPSVNGSEWEQVITDPLSALTNITAVAGTWSIVGGVLRSSGTPYLLASHATAVQRMAVFAEVDVRVPAASTGSPSAGVCWRWNGTENASGHWLAMVLYRASTTAGDPFTSARLIRSNVTSQTIALPSNVAAGTWARVSALITHGGVIGWVDGTVVGTMTAPGGDKLSHRVGLVGGAEQEYRNLSVQALSLPVFS